MNPDGLSSGAAIRLMFKGFIYYQISWKYIQVVQRKSQHAVFFTEQRIILPSTVILQHASELYWPTVLCRLVAQGQNTDAMFGNTPTGCITAEQSDKQENIKIICLPSAF